MGRLGGGGGGRRGGAVGEGARLGARVKELETARNEADEQLSTLLRQIGQGVIAKPLQQPHRLRARVHLHVEDARLERCRQEVGAGHEDRLHCHDMDPYQRIRQQLRLG